MSIRVLLDAAGGHDRAGYPDPCADRVAATPFAVAQQAMRICNACRYCEGFCAVFPAMERRLVFHESDIAFLANLCHDCGECLYSCQYAPPHPFALNLPVILAAARRETYRRYAWPGPLHDLLSAQPRGTWIALAAAPLGMLGILAWVVPTPVLLGRHADAAGAFYRVVSHDAMIGGALVVAALALVGALVALARFWADTGGRVGSWRDGRAFRQAARDALTLRYLDGGGPGCAYPDEVPSTLRRWFHHATAYGFGLCLAATTVAAVYHNVLGWPAPYPVASLPVVLGCVGGVGLLGGPAGLLWLKTRRDPRAADPPQSRSDVGFLLALFLTSLTGFLLLCFRETRAMGLTLGMHLGVVTGLFLTMPYGKFVHAVYRSAALMQHALEGRTATADADERF